MDIMPRAEGQAPVIPETPARGLLDIAPDDARRAHHARAACGEG